MVSNHPYRRILSTCSASVLGIVLLQACTSNAMAGNSALAMELEGFLEPFRSVNVAGDEAGIIDELLVREGEAVVAGQPLARLNSDVHRTLLAIAEHSMQAEGRLEAALAELQLREDRYGKLVTLRAEGHARQEELERARTELAVAQANLSTAREERITKQLEYQRLKAQLQRRTIVAPLAGVVTKLHKQPGEFIAPNNPELLALVQLDPLLANFTVLSYQLPQLKLGDRVQIQMLPGNQQTTGRVEFIAPTIDAESGTLRIKIRVTNADGRYRSGQRCKIRLAAPAAE